MAKYKLYYVAHPYSDNPEQNVKKVTDLIKTLQVSFPDETFLTPLHVFNFHEGELPYEETMEHCLLLLSKCDMAIFPLDYKKSSGCIAELKFCKENGIKYIFEDYEEVGDDYQELYQENKETYYSKKTK